MDDSTPVRMNARPTASRAEPWGLQRVVCRSFPEAQALSRLYHHLSATDHRQNSARQMTSTDHLAGSHAIAIFRECYERAMRGGRGRVSTKRSACSPPEREMSSLLTIL